MIEKDEILKVLNEWIDSSIKQTELFEKDGMDMASIASEAMARAYMNVKQFIEEFE